MALDVTALPEYVDQTSEELLLKSVTEAPSFQILGKQTGIKHKEALQYLDVSLPLQDGSACDFTPSGDDTFSQREIEVCNFKVNKTYCLKDLETKWTQVLLSQGANYDDDQLNAAFFEQYTKRISETNENIIWQGNASAPACSGVTHRVAAATGTTRVASGTAWTETNVVAINKEFVQNIPEEIRNNSELAMFMGQDYFDIYQFEMFDLDKRHVAAEDGMSATTPQSRVLYTNIPIYVVPGLTGTGEVYLTPKNNIVVGTDLESDSDDFKFWFSKDDQNHKFAVNWKMGVQIVFPEYVVYYKA